MIRQNKTTQHAIAAMSRLAELFAVDPEHRVSSIEIARSRNLPKPVVAKILTILAQAGLVSGYPGPGGGYRLARPPAEISLLDVVDIFERDEDDACPFGPGWCGHNDPCPLHDSLVAMRQVGNDYLRNTHFDIFTNHARDKRRRPT
jgi:Rrf2 family transcriptional regulator, iron-sulfur cluster assembly transcription factor